MFPDGFRSGGLLYNRELCFHAPQAGGGGCGVLVQGLFRAARADMDLNSYLHFLFGRVTGPVSVGGWWCVGNRADTGSKIIRQSRRSRNIFPK